MSSIGRQIGLRAATPATIDIFLSDGLLIGVGFAAGARVGTLLVIALTLELLFLGLSVATSLAQANWGRGRNLLCIASLSGLVVAGASLGSALLGGLSGVVHWKSCCHSVPPPNVFGGGKLLARRTKSAAHHRCLISRTAASRLLHLPG